MSSVKDNEAVAVRVAWLEGMTPEDETKVFADMVAFELSGVAQRLRLAAPVTCDHGRFIAGVDTLEQAKGIFIAAAALGNEADKRKKRKAAAMSSDKGEGK